MAQGQLRGQPSVPAPEQVATALPASARYSWLSALRSQWSEAPSRSRSQCPHLCNASLAAHWTAAHSHLTLYASPAEFAPSQGSASTPASTLAHSSSHNPGFHWCWALVFHVPIPSPSS